MKPLPLLPKLGTCAKAAKNNQQKCHFSLPRVKSCPGRTEACSGVHGYCYCAHGHHNYTSVRESRDHNWVLWRLYEKEQKPVALAKLLVHEIRKNNKLDIMRWFEEGDLNSQFAVKVVEYACKQLTEYKHMIPTKSIKLNLNPLAKLDNTSLILSADNDNYKDVIVKANKIKSQGYNCKIAWSAVQVGQHIPKNCVPCPATGIGKLVGKKGACQECKACYQNNSIDVIFYKH